MTNRSFQPELPDVTGEEVRHMSDDELRSFVDDFLAGRIFTSAQINGSQSGHLLQTIFMPLCLGALAGYSDTALSSIGVIWGYMKDALPGSINGYPIFHTMYVLHIDDWKIAIKAIEREQERRKHIEL
jgi:hypothetical protein